MAPQIYPSILSADFSNLQAICELINTSEADAFHLDVMDGVFVPNISFGFPVITAVKKHAKKPLDVHLMIVNPSRYIDRFRDAGADILTIHFEACDDLEKSVAAITKAGMKACIAIKPQTSVLLLRDIMTAIHSVCIMSVNPGFGGQAFIQESFQKVKDTKALIAQLNPAVQIKVDGGVDLSNSAHLVRNGADVLIAGNSVFSALDPEQAIKVLKHSV